MSTAITPTQTSAILPKAVAMLKSNDDKPRLQRTSSIDTIKRINTYICSPQSYLLPAIFTTWLRTSQNGLQSSTEKTIFMFRSVIFGSFLVKYLFKGVRSGNHGGPVTKTDVQKLVLLITSLLLDRLSEFLRNKFVIGVIFKLAVIYLTAQLSLCVIFLTQCIVPVGLVFLFLSLGYIVVLGHQINMFHYRKQIHKVKMH